MSIRARTGHFAKGAEMRLGGIVSELVADPQKLLNYALSPDNPKGKHKAYVFQQKLGYNQGNYELLLHQILTQVMDGEAIATKKDRHGQRYQVDLEIAGINQQQREIVRTVWIVAPSSQELARLVTLYVRK
ncbi:MAG: DUF6883 domain-containing protein [Phormidesmis sp.]